MTLTYFNGLCIGGPIAGQQLTHSAPYYRVPIMEETPSTFEEGDTAEAPETKIFTYKHEIMFRVEEDHMGFWVDVEMPKERRIRFVINSLVAAYQRSPV